MSNHSLLLFFFFLYSDLLFGFAAKVILGSDTARDVYEMEPPMDEAHKQGITIWSDVSISFFHLFAAWIFFSIIQKIEPAMLYKFSYKIVKPTFLQGGKLTLQLLRCLDLFVFCYKLVVFHQKLPNIVNFCEFSAFILSTNACQNLIYFWYSTKCN